MMNFLKDEQWNIENQVNYTDKKEFKKWKEKVLKTIFDLAWRKKSIYRELFYFYPNVLTFKKLQKKFFFKLGKIIAIECKDSPFDIKISSIKDKRDNSTALIANNQSFSMKIKVDFASNHFEESLETTMFWMNKNVYKSQFKNFDPVEHAIFQLGSINKKSFFEFNSGKQKHLLKFLQGMLEDISPDLSIEYIGKNINNNLKTPIDSEFMMSYQNKKIVSFLMEIDEIDFLRKDGSNERWKVRNIPLAKYVTNKRHTVDKWKFIAQTLRIKFANMWNQSDTLYEVVKTVKHLCEMLYQENFANAMSITTSLPLKTKLIAMKYPKNNQMELNFQWYFNTFNFMLEIFNIQYSTIKIDDKKDFYNI